MIIIQPVNHAQPIVEERGIFYDLHRRIQGAYRVHVPCLLRCRYPQRQVHRLAGLEPDEEYILNLCGDTVILNNGLLVQALSRLPVEEQEMLYLSFYHRLSQEKIGKRYGRSRSATGYHIRKSLRRLYEEMEGMTHEE